ncbi:MAG: VOC family protein [Bacteroidaceae bacterium]|nr:VOC family protein [Bacteroidaceae bacterium]
MGVYQINGIQQVGVGTENFKRTRDWLIDRFGADIRILEDDTVAERMLPYTGGVPQKRHAAINICLQGGGGFEIWQYSKRKPEPCPFDVSIGDLGIFAAKVKCRDIDKYSNGIHCSLPDDTGCLYVRDDYGNVFQLVEDKSIYIEEHRLTGGVVGAVIGVTDMDRSVRFYSEVLGYSRVLSDTEGVFSDWAGLSGGSERYRRVILATGNQRRGAFSDLYGDSTIELVQALERVPRKIFDGRFWGDPGFIQICFDVSGMKAFGEFCASKGCPFTVDSCPDGSVFDMGEASGHFTYIEDPDGTLIEFVETHRIPIVARLGWNINLNRRDRNKPLPKILFRMLGVVARQRSGKQK